jgi:hypothetical protein
MCNRHYLKWWLYGDPLAGKTYGSRGAGHMTLGYLRINERLVHRTVAEKMLGRPLLPSEIVHHIDGDRLNNDPCNLQVFASQSEHAAHHARVRRNQQGEHDGN